MSTLAVGKFLVAKGYATQATIDAVDQEEDPILSNEELFQYCAYMNWYFGANPVMVLNSTLNTGFLPQDALDHFEEVVDEFDDEDEESGGGEGGGEEGGD